MAGAGPTGLALACDVARRGVDCLIVEANTDSRVPAVCSPVPVRSSRTWVSSTQCTPPVAPTADHALGRRHPARHLRHHGTP
ncbi:MULTISPECIES: hypothetical protein [unclassified Streptomyces]|uniref:hypothetical protein n=1 Tax=unclassified Streptomyces TaxID=2593676 RepID=UPI00338FF3B6